MKVTLPFMATATHYGHYNHMFADWRDYDVDAPARTMEEPAPPPTDGEPQYIQLAAIQPAATARPIEVVDPNIATGATAQEDDSFAVTTDEPVVSGDPAPAGEETASADSLINHNADPSSPAAILNQHSATGGRFVTVRIEDGENAGTHTMLQNANGEVMGYVYYDANEANIRHITLDEETTNLPDDVVRIFTAENIQLVEYGHGIPGQSGPEALASADASVEEAAIDDAMASARTFGLNPTVA